MRSWSWVNNWRYNREKSDISLFKTKYIHYWTVEIQFNSSYGLTSRLLQLYWVSTDIAAFNRDSSPICFVCTEVCVETFTHSLPFCGAVVDTGDCETRFWNPKGERVFWLRGRERRPFIRIAHPATGSVGCSSGNGERSLLSRRIKLLRLVQIAIDKRTKVLCFVVCLLTWVKRPVKFQGLTALKPRHRPATGGGVSSVVCVCEWLCGPLVINV